MKLSQILPARCLRKYQDIYLNYTHHLEQERNRNGRFTYSFPVRKEAHEERYSPHTVQEVLAADANVLEQG